MHNSLSQKGKPVNLNHNRFLIEPNQQKLIDVWPGIPRLNRSEIFQFDNNLNIISTVRKDAPSNQILYDNLM